MKRRLTALCLALTLLPGKSSALSPPPEESPWPASPAARREERTALSPADFPEEEADSSGDPVPEFVPGVMEEDEEELYYPDYSQWAGLEDALPPSWDSCGLQSPVENQGSTGLCWAFGVLSAMTAQMNMAEYHRNGQELSGLTYYNLSELHMSHALSSRSGNIHEGLDRAPDGGGSARKAASYLMRGTSLSGAVSESDDPFAGYADARIEPRELEETQVKEKVFQARNILFLSGEPDPASFPVIKQAVMTCGGVSASLFWQGQTTATNGEKVQPFYNQDTCAYCYDYQRDPAPDRAESPAETNHLIEIVGWDDGFPRENFSEAARPLRNGAWLIRNSWGADWGDHGYGWVSYEDTNFPNRTCCFSGVENYDPRQIVYETDYLNTGSTFGRSGVREYYAAKVFQKKTGEPEYLDSIRVFIATPFLSIEAGCMPVDSGSTEVQENFIGMGSTGTSLDMPVSCPGWYTVPISDRPYIHCGEGDTFAVTLKITAPSGGEGVYIGYDSNPENSAAPVFYSNNGKYWNLSSSNRNLCIKAVTCPASARGRSQVLVDKAADTLFWPLIRGGNTSPGNVTQSLRLPGRYKLARLTWSSSDGDAVSTDGTVYGARFDRSNAVTLTAGVSWEEPVTGGAAARSVAFDLHVPYRTVTYDDRIAAAQDWWTYEHWWESIGGENTDWNHVRTDLTIPQSITVSPENCEPYQLPLYAAVYAGSKEDVNVPWESVSSSGAVRRPAYGQPDSKGSFFLTLCDEAGKPCRYLGSWILTVLAYRGAITAAPLPDAVSSTDYGTILRANVSTEGNPGDLQYQWYRSDSAGMDDAVKLEGGTGAELRIASTSSTENTAYYCCEISAPDAAPVRTNAAKVTLIPGYPTAQLGAGGSVRLYHVDLPENAAVFAARYDIKGRLLEAARAEGTEGNLVTFGGNVDFGWKLFCLDSGSRPLCAAPVIH